MADTDIPASLTGDIIADDQPLDLDVAGDAPDLQARARTATARVHFLGAPVPRLMFNDLPGVEISFHTFEDIMQESYGLDVETDRRKVSVAKFDDALLHHLSALSDEQDVQVYSRGDRLSEAIVRVRDRLPAHVRPILCRGEREIVCSLRKDVAYRTIRDVLFLPPSLILSREDAADWPRLVKEFYAEQGEVVRKAMAGSGRFGFGPLTEEQVLTALETQDRRTFDPAHQFLQKKLDGWPVTIDAVVDPDGKLFYDDSRVCLVQRRGTAVAAILNESFRPGTRKAELLCEHLDFSGDVYVPLHIDCLLTPDKKLYGLEYGMRFGYGAPDKFHKVVIELNRGADPQEVLRRARDDGHYILVVYSTGQKRIPFENQEKLSAAIQNVERARPLKVDPATPYRVMFQNVEWILENGALIPIGDADVTDRPVSQRFIEGGVEGMSFIFLIDRGIYFGAGREDYDELELHVYAPRGLGLEAIKARGFTADKLFEEAAAQMGKIVFCDEIPVFLFRSQDGKVHMITTEQSMGSRAPHDLAVIDPDKLCEMTPRPHYSLTTVDGDYIGYVAEDGAGGNRRRGNLSLSAPLTATDPGLLDELLDSVKRAAAAGQ